jgi:hypothetical protein
MGRRSRTTAERRQQRELASARAAAWSDLAKERRAAPDFPGRACLICLASDGGFTTPEHLVPESLGGTWTLPPGTVCDRCNWEVCALLDKGLTEYHPIQVHRAMMQVPSKKGTMPQAKFDNGTVRTNASGNVEVTLHNRRWWQADPPDAPPPRWQGFKATRSDATDPNRLSLAQRALAKMSLESLWLDDADRAFSDEYDDVRRIILHGGHHGYLSLFGEIVVPVHAMPTGIAYAKIPRPDGDGSYLFVVFWLRGLPIITDTLNRQPTPEIAHLIDQVFAGQQTSPERRVVTF